MNRQSIRDYILRQQQRYHKANRTEKGRILDEVVAITGYHRKSAVRLLSGRSRGGRGARVGRPVEYGPKVAAALRLVHEAGRWHRRKTTASVRRRTGRTTGEIQRVEDGR